MTTIVATVCVGCGTPTKEPIKGRCPNCAPAHELDRKAARADREPWQRLYGLAVWKRCRAAVLDRDGHRCRLRISKACTRTERLRAHHSPRRTRELWAMAAGVWDVFLELACDPLRVITACEPCHVLDDKRRQS